jgi:hypothetical protein
MAYLLDFAGDSLREPAFGRAQGTGSGVAFAGLIKG